MRRVRLPSIRIQRSPRRYLTLPIVALALLAPAAAQVAPANSAAESNPAAEQGVPGTPDPTAPHQGTATPAAVEEKKRPRAVSLSVLYTAELWRNTSGGTRRGGRYLDNLDVTLTVDAERALGWRGATLFVYGLYNNGHSFSGDLVGDAQTVSNIETGVKAARLYQAWVEQRFADDRASIKVGLYDLNSEFDSTNVGSLSLLSSHGIGPEFGQSGQNGPSIFPYTSLAVRGEYKVAPALTVRAAVLDGVPDDPLHPRRTAIILRRGDGVLGVAEADYVGRAVNITAGYWRYSARFEGWPSGAVATGEHGNDGAYVVAEGRLTRRDGASSDDKRGLAGFVQAGAADPRFNRIARYLGAGLVYTGVLGSREDRLGVTIARATFSDAYQRYRAGDGVEVKPAESVVELTYRRALNRYVTLQPDVQYIVAPSGDRTLHDALALGLRIELGV